MTILGEPVRLAGQIEAVWRRSMKHKRVYGKKYATTRGAALLTTLVYSLLFAAVVLFTVRMTNISHEANDVEDNYAQALAAAEYGAELAIAELTAGLEVQAPENSGSNAVNDNAVVVGDWILGRDQGAETLFATDAGRAADQRRISGVYDGHHFRVKVRSARLAYGAGEAEDAAGNLKVTAGWLDNPGPFVFGRDRVHQFKDIYEITATAENNLLDDPQTNGGVPARLRPQPVLRTVVRYGINSPLNDMLEVLGPLHAEDPRNFQLRAASNPEPEYDSQGLPLLNGDGVKTSLVDNILISGEDHHFNNRALEEYIGSTVTIPEKIATNRANFFAATGDFWNGGHLTLNYLINDETDTPENWDEPNPYRPYTVTLGSGGGDTGNQAMRKRWPNRSPDVYLLGGKTHQKVGKTVTLASDPKFSLGERIVETYAGPPAGAANGGEFTIVLHQFEDLRNLYINMTTGYGAGVAYPYTWYQMFIGQYTKDARDSRLDPASAPVYAGKRIRAQTLHAMLNSREEKLVREYERPTARVGGQYAPSEKAYHSDGKGTDYFLFPIGGSEWKGNYTWAKTSFKIRTEHKYGYFSLDEGEIGAGEVCVPRLFFWQELVEYSLVKRQGGGTVGHPALVSTWDKRTHYRTDASGERIKVGFDEAFQDNPVVTAKRTNPGYLVDTFPGSPDYIDILNVRLREDDRKSGLRAGELKPHRTMSDFLFEKNFATNPETDPPNLRQALGLFIGYEDQQEEKTQWEEGADYNYADMLFTIYIAPPVAAGSGSGADRGQANEQWWEIREEDGLTGDTARPAISVNSPDSYGKDSTEALREAFELMGHSPKEDMEDMVVTMHTSPANELSGFPRAVFRMVDGICTGVLDFDDERMEEHRDNGVRTFYFSKGDVESFMQNNPERYFENQNGDPATAQAAYEAAAADMMALNPQYTLLEMEKRWKEEETIKSTLQGESLPSALQVLRGEVDSRWMAGQIIGSGQQKIPALRTREFRPLSDAEPTELALGFLAGEVRHSADAAEEGITPDGMIPYRAPIPVPWEKEADGTPRLAEIRQFLADDLTGTAAAVAMCYRSYYANDPATEAEILGAYGLKDRRGSIGFHRGGIAEALAASHQRDRYEFVSLGVRGFNPYRVTDNWGADYVALEQTIAESPEDVTGEKYEQRFKYASDDAGVPDFVFADPLDGAGAMVVNGNLIVEDTLAYYGTLVVLGDVVVRPKPKTTYVWGASGNPIDKYGHALRLVDPFETDAERMEWFYYRESSAGREEIRYEIDAEGLPVRDEKGKPVPVRPLTQKVVRGELVVQGNLLVKGRIRNETTVHPETGATHTGKVRVCWSREAIENTASLWSDGQARVERISWVHDDTIDAGSLWQDRLDAAAPHESRGTVINSGAIQQ